MKLQTVLLSCKKFTFPPKGNEMLAFDHDTNAAADDDWYSKAELVSCAKLEPIYSNEADVWEKEHLQTDFTLATCSQSSSLRLCLRT